MRVAKPAGDIEEGRVYTSALDAMPLGMAIFRLDDVDDPGSFRLLKFNPAAARIVGHRFPLREALGKTLREAAPATLETDQAWRYVDVIRSGTPQDVGDIASVLEPGRIFAVKAFPLPEQCLGVVFEDVTDRRLAVERIRRSERQLLRAQQLAGMGSWVWDVASGTLSWSEELCRIYGLAPDAAPATYDAFIALVHPDDRTLVEAGVRRSLERRQPFRFRERILRPDGEVRELDSQGDIVTSEHGEPVEMFGLCRDVTDDERALRALRESEQRFAKAVQASPIAICLIKLSDRSLIEVNARFAELLGFPSRRAVTTRRAGDLGMWAAPGEWDAMVAALRQRRSIPEAGFTFRTRDGQTRRALAAVELIEVGGEECLLALVWRT